MILSTAIFLIGGVSLYHAFRRMQRYEAITDQTWQQYAEYQKERWERLRDSYMDSAGMQMIISGCCLITPILFWIWNIVS